MKIKLGELNTYKPLYDKINTEDLPISTMYRFFKIFTIVEKETDFYNSHLRELVQTYAARDDKDEIIYTDTGDIKLQVEKLEEFNAKMTELDSIEVELPDEKFKLSDLELLKLNYKEMSLLAKFIEE